MSCAVGPNPSRRQTCATWRSITVPTSSLLSPAPAVRQRAACALRRSTGFLASGSPPRRRCPTHSPAGPTLISRAASAPLRGARTYRRAGARSPYGHTRFAHIAATRTTPRWLSSAAVARRDAAERGPARCARLAARGVCAACDRRFESGRGSRGGHVTDTSGAVPGQPWIPASILGDFQWSGGHFAGGWQRFFERRGVVVQEAAPSDPTQPWVPPELLEAMVF